MKESEIRAKLKQGWIRAIVTFEIAGKPQKHIEDALQKYIENIRKDTRIVVLQEGREEAIKHEDGIFSAFSECEMLVQDMETFTWLCVNFSPASIEVLEPDEIAVEARNITNWLNDLLAKIHDVAQDYRNQKGAKDHLVIAMNQLIMNAILLGLRSGKRTQAQLAKDVGIGGEQLAPFLSKLIEKGTIAQVDKAYALAK
jgi:hypothetical protein